jgi:hypothetical protein
LPTEHPVFPLNEWIHGYIARSKNGGKKANERPIPAVQGFVLANLRLKTPLI